MKPIEFKAEFSMSPSEVRALVVEEAEKRVPGYKVKSARFVVHDMYDSDSPGSPPSPELVDIQIVMEKKQ